MKKTAWYPASVKPVCTGKYECFVFYPSRGSFKTFFVWSGHDWRTKDGYGVPFGVAGDKWRGLTEKAA